MNDMRIPKTPGNIALGIVAGKEGNVKIHGPTTNLVLACLLFLVVALTATPAFAAPRAEALPHTYSAPGRTVTSGPSDPEEMEAFLDSFFEAKMAELHIPGAAIVVVQDGQVFLSKGYGYADLARQTPVDPPGPHSGLALSLSCSPGPLSCKWSNGGCSIWMPTSTGT